VNNLGKTLVVVNLALSLLGLGWAVAVVTSPVDWGKKEAGRVWTNPAEGKNERRAARIDERLALKVLLADERLRALARVKQAEEAVRKAEAHFGYNHLAYVYELARLEAGQGDAKDPRTAYLVAAGVLSKDAAAKGQFVVREVKFLPDGSAAVIPNAAHGLPVFERIVTALEKPYAAYLKDYYDLVGEVKLNAKGEVEEVIKPGILGRLHAENAQWLAKKEQLTEWLNGKRAGDKVIKPGLYDLQEQEAEIQRRLREELTYLQPLWVRELYNAQLLRSRRMGLEKRLRELGVSPESVVP
jgi:hypothetical protein